MITDPPSLKKGVGQVLLHLAPPGTARAAGLPDSRRKAAEAAAAAGDAGAGAAGREDDVPSTMMMWT